MTIVEVYSGVPAQQDQQVFNLGWITVEREKQECTSKASSKICTTRGPATRSLLLTDLCWLNLADTSLELMSSALSLFLAHNPA